jgi:hypothetical protein
MEDKRAAAETHLAMLGVKIAGTAFRVLNKKMKLHSFTVQLL